MFASVFGRRRPRTTRPQVEGLEDRRLLATLPVGYTESAVATGLTDATAMELAPDGRLWVLEQAGEVQVFHAGSTAGSVALEIPASAIDHSGERGLLGIAFDPSYEIASAAPDFVYLYYTSTAGEATHNRISRFTVDNSDPDRPTLSGEAVLVDLDPLSSATNHNGGAIHFGPDGKLYVAVGDNANGSNAQSLSTRLGKILRFNADGTVPADNPTSFAGVAGTTTGPDRAIWALGLRNPYTFAFEPGTGRMFINDVGQSAFEEINPGQAGANYGWPTTEGDFDPARFPAFTRPLYSYAHGTGTFEGFAITGGAFYAPADSAPARFPASFSGDYFFADFVGNWINVIDPATGAVTRFAADAAGPVDLRVAADGSLLYLSRGEGTVSRIAPPPPTTTSPPRVADDYDGDGRSDIAAQLATLGAFAYRQSTGGDVVQGFGTDRLGETIPAPGDYDGDGRTDVAGYLPRYGVLAYRPSSGGSDQLIRFGPDGLGLVVPAPGDYDGDGRTDVALFVPATATYLIRPSGGTAPYAVQFGAAGAGQSLPLPGDFDGDDKADLAVYIPTLGQLFFRSTVSGADVAITFGPTGAGASIPLAGDYNGDGRTDLALYLPGSGTFAIMPMSVSSSPDAIPYAVDFGAAGPGYSQPITGDFDGDGKADLAVYIPLLGSFASRPSGGGADVLQPFGSGGETTIPASARPAILPRTPLVQSLALREGDPAAGLVFFLPEDVMGRKKPTA